MPQTTPQNYLEATRNYGATVDLQPTIRDAFNKIKDYESQGRIFIHPFDDPLVMAGQGTLGVEVMEDLPGTTDIIISIGGGGFEGGVSTAVKAIKPGVRIWALKLLVLMRCRRHSRPDTRLNLPPSLPLQKHWVLLLFLIEL
jgi:threonine dehydratase